MQLKVELRFTQFTRFNDLCPSPSLSLQNSQQSINFTILMLVKYILRFSQLPYLGRHSCVLCWMTVASVDGGQHLYRRGSLRGAHRRRLSSAGSFHGVPLAPPTTIQPSFLFTHCPASETIHGLFSEYFNRYVTCGNFD